MIMSIKSNKLSHDILYSVKKRKMIRSDYQVFLRCQSFDLHGNRSLDN